MDEHGSKAAYIGGGLIIALVIIGIVFGIYNVAAGMSRTGTSKLTKMGGTLQDSEFTQYDGAILNGDQVQALIKEHQADEISIVVDNGKGARNYIFESSGASDGGKATLGNKIDEATMKTRLYEASTKTKDGYISPSKQFQCTICRDNATDAIVAMYFKEPTK